MTASDSPPPYTIRCATLLDLPAIYQLERQIFPSDAYPYPDLALLLLSPRVVNLKGVDASGMLVGYACGTRTLFPHRPGWIVTLGVAATHQNQGWGGALLHACETHLNRPRIRLTVRKSNAPAIHLYRKNGYQVIATRTRYYRDGEDGLLMERQNPPPLTHSG